MLLAVSTVSGSWVTNFGAESGVFGIYTITMQWHTFKPSYLNKLFFAKSLIDLKVEIKFLGETSAILGSKSAFSVFSLYLHIGSCSKPHISTSNRYYYDLMIPSWDVKFFPEIHLFWREIARFLYLCNIHKNYSLHYSTNKCTLNKTFLVILFNVW